MTIGVRVHHLHEQSEISGHSRSSLRSGLESVLSESELLAGVSAKTTQPNGREDRRSAMPKEMGMSKEMGMPNEMRMKNGQGGHLYIQTNEIRNAIIHYRRSADGTIAEAERCSTGGVGSGTFKPISGQESAPNAFEGAGSIALTPDRRFLFT